MIGTGAPAARDRDLALGTGAAVLAAALFGTLGPLSRFAADAGVEGVAFTAWRAGVGAVALAVLLVVGGRSAQSWRALTALPRNGRAALALAAFMGLTLNAAIFTAFGLVPIALALMLFYTYPAGVAAVDVVLGDERLTRARLLALGLASLGVVLVLAGGAGIGRGAPDPLGIVLGLVAAASQVVFMTLSRNGYRTVPADVATLLILCASLVGASALAIVVGQGPALLVPLASLEPWPILLLAGVAAAAVSSVLFLTSIRRIGGTRAGILMLFEPVVGVLLAGLLLGEALGPIQALGGALVLAGALVLQVSAQPAREPVADEAGAHVV